MFKIVECLPLLVNPRSKLNRNLARHIIVSVTAKKVLQHWHQDAVREDGRLGSPDGSGWSAAKIVAKSSGVNDDDDDDDVKEDDEDETTLRRRRLVAGLLTLQVCLNEAS